MLFFKSLDISHLMYIRISLLKSLLSDLFCNVVSGIHSKINYKISRKIGEEKKTDEFI